MAALIVNDFEALHKLTPFREREFMKMRTHSGAKKRLRLLSGGKVKRKQTRLRHLNSHMSSKVKRHLGEVVYVDDANMYQTRRLLVF